MLLIPKREELLHKQVGTRDGVGAPWVWASTPSSSSTTTRPSKLQFYANTEWIRVINSGYTIGLDGISLPLYFLSMVITVLVMIY